MASITTSSSTNSSITTSPITNSPLPFINIKREYSYPGKGVWEAENENDKPTRECEISSACIQNRSAQDYVVTGSYEENGETIYCIGNFDGHGYGENGNIIINAIRDLDFVEIMRHDDPVASIRAALPTDKRVENSGSTACLVKIYHNRAVVWWIGDSEIMISDGVGTVFKNTKHDTDYSPDMTDLILSGLAVKEVGKKNKGVVVDENTMEMTHSVYMYFPSINSRFNMTRALGHRNISDKAEMVIIPFEQGKKYTVFTCSDGVGDMLRKDGGDEPFIMAPNTTPMQIAEWARARWRQQWCFKGFDPKYKSAYPPNSTDDISCALFKHVEPVP